QGRAASSVATSLPPRLLAIANQDYKEARPPQRGPPRQGKTHHAEDKERSISQSTRRRRDARGERERARRPRRPAGAGAAQGRVRAAARPPLSPDRHDGQRRGAPARRHQARARPDQRLPPYPRRPPPRAPR